MRNFKRVVVSALSVALCFAVLVGAAVFPYFTMESYYYQDNRVRKELAGTIDFLFIGASHGLRAMDPRVLDGRLGCSSYNLSGAMETMQGRYHLLEQEVKRNPVSIVVIELSYNALTRTYEGSGFEGNVYHLGRMDNPAQWASYFLSAVPPRDYIKMTYDTVARGLNTWLRLWKGEVTPPVQYETHGFVPCKEYTPQPGMESFLDSYHTQRLELDIDGENQLYLEKMLTLCRDKNIQVILVVTPLSESTLWIYDGFDTVLGWYRELSETWGCPLYDFNLLKDKLERYPQDIGFYDGSHLQEEYAAVFTEDFAQILQMAQSGERVEDLFYDTYEEAIHARLEEAER